MQEINELIEHLFFSHNMKSLIPAKILHDLVHELHEVLILAKLQEYEVNLSFDGEKNHYNYQISFKNHQKIQQYTITLSVTHDYVSTLYIFNDYTFFPKVEVPSMVNVNAYGTMFSASMPQGMVNCLKFFSQFI